MISKIELYDENHPKRCEAETFIKKVFLDYYNAKINYFAPNILCLIIDNKIVAAAGYKEAKNNVLYLEKYLDKKIDVILNINRDDIIEVGNLCAINNYGKVFLLSLKIYFFEKNYKWIASTLTKELELLFKRIKINPIFLKDNLKSYLSKEELDMWGSYYEHNPKVMIGEIKN